MVINNKPTIEQALANKLPLPWKTQGLTGPEWAVKRQRPEDLTADLFWNLDAYGMKRGTIRELFYIMSVDFSPLLKKLGIGKGKPGGKMKEPKAVIPPKPIYPPKPLRVHDNERPDGARFDKYDNPVTVTKPIKFDPIDASAEDDDGLNYQDRHALGRADTPVHSLASTPTPSPTIDLSTWSEFIGSKASTDGNLLSVGKKLHSGPAAGKSLQGWTRCAILVSPDIKKVALRKTATGVKVQTSEKYPWVELACKAAVDKIIESYPNRPRYRLSTITPDLLIFAMEK